MVTKTEIEQANMSASFRARVATVWIATREETRTKLCAFDAAAASGYETVFWSIASGFTLLDGTSITDEGKGDPEGALDYIREQSKRGSESSPNRKVWVMCDLPTWLVPPIGAVPQRKLRELQEWLPAQPQWSAQSIVILSPSAEVPAELADDTTVIDWPLPEREEIAAILDATVAALPKELQKAAVNGQREAAIDAAVGLSGNEAQATFSRSLVRERGNAVIDPAMIAAEKERSIRGSGLEWLKPLNGGWNAVGGLDIWKQYTTTRGMAYSQAARDYGLQMPKGVLLLGVPGCGKTLSALALGGEWNVPVIKLDLGALKGKYVGQSEASIRQAFAKLDAIGRCIVLVDEIEKALAGSTGEAGDGGVAADALGALLSWMNDRTSEAFVIATANNIDKLPPELLRKGRFDQIFWVGLPNEVERAGVLRAELTKRGRDADAIGIDLAAVAAATDKFSGAEIAALVPEAMFTAFAEDGREITTSDILDVAASIKPKGTDKQRPDFAKESTSSTVAASNGRVKVGRKIDL